MTDAADNYQNSRSQWQQEQERRLQVALNAATETAKVIKARGITQIEFDYYGWQSPSNFLLTRVPFSLN